jgi:pyridoxine 4-dehydrogenase
MLDPTNPYLSARVDPKTEIKDTMKHLLTLKDEGHFQYIGLSEVSAKTIVSRLLTGFLCSARNKERAAKVATIAAVEVEYSLWALDIEKNGVLSTCNKLNIPIVAYSPLGRLVGQSCAATN